MEAEQKVEQALMLLASIDAESISLKEAVEIVELVTAVPELVRRTIAIAEERGIIRREGSTLMVKERAGARGRRALVRRRKCSAQCVRCGRRISNCFFILIAGSELGPLGSECIKRLKLGAQSL